MTLGMVVAAFGLALLLASGPLARFLVAEETRRRGRSVNTRGSARIVVVIAGLGFLTGGVAAMSGLLER